MANCEYAKTFLLIGRVVRAEFDKVKLLLVATVPVVLEIPAAHFYGCRFEIAPILNLVVSGRVQRMKVDVQLYAI